MQGGPLFVVFVCRCPPPSSPAASLPLTRSPTACSTLQLEDIERLFKEVTDKWGTVDVLCNNAVSLPQGCLLYTSRRG